jgi:putative NIF3 family GTP cyclohydrolase 1 type 2
MTDLSRREFAAIVAGGAIAGRVADALAQTQQQGRSTAVAPSAVDVIERIKKNIGVEWKSDTVDGVKAGDTAVRVTGVVTTAMATMAVLQQAVKAGANFVVTSEPTFFSRSDSRTPAAAIATATAAGATGGIATAAQTGVAVAPADPVFAAKNDFIRKNNLVIFRLSDHWRLRTPDPLAQGIASALAWTSYRSAVDPLRFEIPALTLDALATHVKQRLHARGGVRVVGDPRVKVTRVGLLPATTPIQAALKMLPAVDVIVAGEVREWESVEYARDVVFADRTKGLILVGRVVSEESGMEICAGWLKTFIPEVPVRHISTGDPYWRPVS